jgi:hypothetical protein
MDTSLLLAVLAALVAVFCFFLLYRTTKVGQPQRNRLLFQVLGILAVGAALLWWSIEL